MNGTTAGIAAGPIAGTTSGIAAVPIAGTTAGIATGPIFWTTADMTVKGDLRGIDMELKLIDVSMYQGDIDWTKVKANVDGAIIRCGYGSDYVGQDDPKFKKNADGCVANQIPFGVYLYSYAKNVTSAKSEAAHVLRLVEPYRDRLSFPIYLDLEQAGTASGAVERAIQFGNLVEAAGYWCGIYANQYWWKSYLKNGLDRFTKWVAKYSNEKPSGISGTYDIWQYSSTGSVPGINGNVDLNLCYKNFPQIIRGTSGKEEEDGKADKDREEEEGRNVEEGGQEKENEQEKEVGQAPEIHSPIYKVGDLYKTQVELKVRTGPGTGYPEKTYAQLTENAKKNDPDKNGTLRQGTEVTCLEVRENGGDIWIRIPSGWIAAYYRGSVYVK